MEDDVAKKQMFLYNQIIEAGYKPQLFQQFMLKNNKIGDDLSKWKMSQLKALVKEFKHIHLKKIQHESQKQIISANKSKQQRDLTIANNESNIDQRMNQIQTQEKSMTSAQIFYKDKEIQQNFKSTIKCDQVSKSSFFDWPFLEIKIIKCDKKEGGIFQKSYIQYTIQIPKLEIVVQRRYSDFVWLKQTLQLLHPGMPIPPVSKKGVLRRYDQKHLKKRIYILQMFLNKVIGIPQIKADPLFQRFLTMKDKKQFQSYKNEFKKMQAVTINKIRNIKGSVELNLTKDVIFFNNLSKNYFMTIQPDVKKIYKEFKGAATSLQGSASFLKSISANCKQLAAKDAIFRTQANFSSGTVNFYTLLQKMTMIYSDCLIEEAKVFRKQIYSIVKYESLSMLNLIQSYQKLNALQIQFLDQKNALNKKKQKLYGETNMSKWGIFPLPPQKPALKQDAFGIMLPKQTNQLLKLRDAYA